MQEGKSNFFLNQGKWDYFRFALVIQGGERGITSAPWTADSGDPDGGSQIKINSAALRAAIFYPGPLLRASSHRSPE